MSRVRAKQVRLVGARQRVVVDDAVDRLVLVLQPHVVADRAELVPEVDHARRLDAGEDARALHRASRGAGSAQARSSSPRSIAERIGHESAMAVGYHSR